MDRTVHLSFGDFPGREYAMQLFADMLIHGWDLARAIGADEQLDPELVAALAAWFADMADAYRAAGAVGPRPECLRRTRTLRPGCSPTSAGWPDPVSRATGREAGHGSTRRSRGSSWSARPASCWVRCRPTSTPSAAWRTASPTSSVRSSSPAASFSQLLQAQTPAMTEVDDAKPAHAGAGQVLELAAA